MFLDLLKKYLESGIYYLAYFPLYWGQISLRFLHQGELSFFFWFVFDALDIGNVTIMSTFPSLLLLLGISELTLQLTSSKALWMHFMC